MQMRRKQLSDRRPKSLLPQGQYDQFSRRANLEVLERRDLLAADSLSFDNGFQPFMSRIDRNLELDFQISSGNDDGLFAISEVDNKGIISVASGRNVAHNVVYSLDVTITHDPTGLMVSKNSIKVMFPSDEILGDFREARSDLADETLTVPIESEIAKHLNGIGRTGDFLDVSENDNLTAAGKQRSTVENIATIINGLDKSENLKSNQALSSLYHAIGRLGEKVTDNEGRLTPREADLLGRSVHLIVDDIGEDIAHGNRNLAGKAEKALAVLSEHSSSFWVGWNGLGVNPVVSRELDNRILSNLFYESGQAALTSGIVVDLIRPASVQSETFLPTATAISQHAPSSDANVYNIDGSGNYGSATDIKVANTSFSGLDLIMESYVRVDLSPFSQSVNSVDLNLTPVQVDASVTHEIATVYDDSWTESGVTWDNRPDVIGTSFQQWSPQIGTDVAIDITAEAQRALVLGDINLSGDKDFTGPYGDLAAFEMAVKNPTGANGYQATYGVLPSDAAVVPHGDANRDGVIDNKDTHASHDSSQAYAGFFEMHGKFRGDADLSDVVDVADQSIVTTFYGTQTGATYAQGDLNFDGAVDSADIVIVFQETNSVSTGPSSPSLSLRISSVSNPSSPVIVAYGSKESSDGAEITVDDLGGTLFDDDGDGLGIGKELQLGTDPNNPDTDGDMLVDGFEADSQSLDPLVPNDKNADPDTDTLDNLDEQINGTNPDAADTDGDGVNDNVEINQGSNPNDPSDGGQPPSSNEYVTVTITIGDDSGSNSEFYRLDVGSESTFGHPCYAGAPNPEPCATREINLLRGQEYEISIHHLTGDNDIDFVSDVVKTDPQDESPFVLEDPDGILGGNHFDSPHLLDKTATLYLPVIDIDTDSDNDGTIDGSTAEDNIEDVTDPKGKRVFLNIDDDNQNGKADNTDAEATFTNPDNDLAKIKLEFDPKGMNGYELWLGAQVAGLKLYANAKKKLLTPDDTQTPGGQPWYIWKIGPGGVNFPSEVFVEGIAEGSHKVHWRLKKTNDPNGTIHARDTVRINVEKVVWPFTNQADPNWQDEPTYDWHGMELKPAWYIEKSLEELITNPNDKGKIETIHPDTTRNGKPAASTAGESSQTTDTYANGFTMEFKYSFERSRNAPNGYVNHPSLYRLGFVGNSGVKFGTALTEVAILDVAAMIAEGGVNQSHVSGTGTVDVNTPIDYDARPVNQLMTGIIYQGSYLNMLDNPNYDPQQSSLPTGSAGYFKTLDDNSDRQPTNNEADPNNEMKIDVTKDGANYDLEVYINDMLVFKHDDLSIPGLGKLDLQSHWGSGVIFKDMSIIKK